MSGNFGENELCYPAAYKYKKYQASPIVVSGISEGNKRMLSSNYSLDVDVCAPAKMVLSTYPKELDVDYNRFEGDNINYDGYVFCEGTSYAGAYVSGLAAILKAFDKSLDNNYLKEIIISGCEDIGDEGKDENFGYGLINFSKSLYTPRMRIECDDIIEENEELNCLISLVDYQGQIIETVSSDVYNEGQTELQISIREYLDDNDIYILKDHTVSEMVYGTLSVIKKINKVGLYDILVDSKNHSFVKNRKKIIVRPSPVIPSLPSGVYSQSIKVSLQCMSPSSQIYYTYGDIPVVISNKINPLALKYTSEIPIDSSCKLNVVAVKQDIISSVNTFIYSISKSSNNKSNAQRIAHAILNTNPIVEISKDSSIEITKSNIIISAEREMALFKLDNSTDNKALRFVLSNSIIKEFVDKDYTFCIDCNDIKIGIPNNKLKELLSYDKVEINIDKEDLFDGEKPIFSYCIKVTGDGDLINVNNLMDLFVMLEEDMNINQLALYYLDKDNNLRSRNNYFLFQNTLYFRLLITSSLLH